MKQNRVLARRPARFASIVEYIKGKAGDLFPRWPRPRVLAQGNHALIQAFVHDQVNAPETFDLNISVEDEMYLFLLDQFKSNRTLAYLEYLRSGKQLMDVVRQVVQWRFNGFDNVSTFLDFASGYGRFTRFLIQELPPQRIWSADIYADAVKFQQEQFGVNGVISVRNPDDFIADRKYDCIFVASLFSHLPEPTFLGWLQKLFTLLNPSGVLMFSVLDVAVMPPNLTMPEKGMMFVLDSESRTLPKEDYGLAYVTEDFVGSLISEVTGGRLKYYRTKRGVYQYQDLYVIVNDQSEDFASLDLCPGPMGALDKCVPADNRGFHLFGWAADLCKHCDIQLIQVLTNGRVIGECRPTYDRPDVADAFRNNQLLRSGWSCSVQKDKIRLNDIVLVKAVNSKNLERVLYVDTALSLLRDVSYQKAQLAPSVRCWIEKIELLGSKLRAMVSRASRPHFPASGSEPADHYPKDLGRGLCIPTRRSDFPIAPARHPSATLLYCTDMGGEGKWEAKIHVINLSNDQPLEGVFKAYNNKGACVCENTQVSLSPHASRKIAFSSEALNASEIAYVVFESTAGAAGYSAFYKEGACVLALPAMSEVSSGDIYIPHIACDQDWWTKIMLINTTSLPKRLTVEFNQGESRTLILPPRGSYFDYINEFFDEEIPVGVQAAVIKNGNGIIGLELLGSSGESGKSYLGGIPLRDNLTAQMFFPHITTDLTYWTGVVAYNPSAFPCVITITPYSAAGTPLTRQAHVINGKEKRIDMTANLNLPVDTSWYRIEATSPIAGFEGVGTNDGSRLALYPGFGINGKEGVFVKLEKDSDTRISLVNIEDSPATVILTGYDDSGTALDRANVSLAAYEKMTTLAENLFSKRIGLASYFTFLSDRELINF